MPALNPFDQNEHADEQDRPLFRVIVGPDRADTQAICDLAIENVVATDPYTAIIRLNHLCPAGPGEILTTIGANAAADTDSLIVLTNVFGERIASATVVDEDDNEFSIDDPINEFGYPSLIWWLDAANSAMTSAIITLTHLTLGLNRAEHDDGNEESDHQFSIANTLPAVDALHDAGATFVLLPGVPVPDVLDAFGTAVAAVWADAPAGKLLIGTYDGHDHQWTYAESPLPARPANRP